MGSNQTPEEMKINIEPDTYLALLKASYAERDSLSTEIERLKSVCDSMAERNKKLEKAISFCIDIFKNPSPTIVHVLYHKYASDLEQLLSNKNNKK